MDPYMVLTGMSLYEICRDPCGFKRDELYDFQTGSYDLKGIHMILKGMGLYEFYGDPSIPTKPARTKEHNSGGPNVLCCTAFGQLLDYPL